LAHAKPAPAKSVFWVILVIVCIILVLGAVSAFRIFHLFANDSGVPSSVIFEEVKRGVFLHEVTDRGNVESSQNEDILCQVENQTGSMTGTLIIWLIPEGTLVEEGEVLCRLDSSNLEERFANQEITVANSEASWEQAKADLSIAKLAEKEYINGTLEKEKLIIENKISKAREDWSRATDTLDFTKKLLAQGYVTELQEKADTAKVEQLENDLKAAELEMKVLLEYTSEKMLEQFSANILTARVKEISAQRRYKIDNDRLEYLRTQIEYCTIKAPKSGQVVYATPNTPWRRDTDIIKEGNSVRERQVVFRLPDMRYMQVAGMVNEARVSLVKVGQPATITLEAMPTFPISGTVKLVKDFPEPDGMMGSMTKEYKTIVSMDDLDSLPPNLRAGIRPGLTAQIKINVTDPNLEPNPILVPILCLFEHDNKRYCITYENGKWEKVEVEVGATNDKEVIIKKGLTEGQRIVHPAWSYIKHVLSDEELAIAKEFGVGGARQRRGPGGPVGPGGGPGGFEGGPGGGQNRGPGGPNAPGGPGGPSGPGGIDGSQPRGPGGDSVRPEGGSSPVPGNAGRDGIVPTPGEGMRNNRPDGPPSGERSLPGERPNRPPVTPDSTSTPQM